ATRPGSEELPGCGRCRPTDPAHRKSTMTEHRSTARNEDQAESSANLWVWFIGLALLVFFHLYHGYARSLQIPEAFDTVAELVFRDLGVALIVAATVHCIFDKGDHRKMLRRPLRDA